VRRLEGRLDAVLLDLRCEGRLEEISLEPLAAAETAEVTALWHWSVMNLALDGSWWHGRAMSTGASS
jgi:hypothetical protein